MTRAAILLAPAALIGLAFPALAQKASEKMSFFITSAGSGDGANLGGLKGADQHCQTLAKAVGAGGRTWRAYLSSSGSGSEKINARDRIGKGPWYNVKGEVVAKNVEDLHGPDNKLGKETSLTEKG